MEARSFSCMGQTWLHFCSSRDSSLSPVGAEQLSTTFMAMRKTHTTSKRRSRRPTRVTSNIPALSKIAFTRLVASLVVLPPLGTLDGSESSTRPHRWCGISSSPSSSGISIYFERRQCVHGAASLAMAMAGLHCRLPSRAELENDGDLPQHRAIAPFTPSLCDTRTHHARGDGGGGGKRREHSRRTTSSASSLYSAAETTWPLAFLASISFSSFWRS